MESLPTVGNVSARPLPTCLTPRCPTLNRPSTARVVPHEAVHGTVTPGAHEVCRCDSPIDDDKEDNIPDRAQTQETMSVYLTSQRYVLYSPTKNGWNVAMTS